MEMRPFGRLIPPLTARRRLLDSARPVGRVERCRIEEAFDRVAARSVRAPRPVPAFARATWDGYAVRSWDTADARPDRPKGFQVVGE
ncbi:MAG TPA: molybdenum cofactor biosynthesis protein, partial [Thermoplasmata archaeon]|nr:molybdenum cofactor biosynthesis protein [Thermoplasmata archaeon]